MQIDRRELLAAAAALVAGSCTLSRAARAPKSLLVLGGTRFIGPPIVEAALARGHRVTLFNRGRTNPELFAQCEKLRGDRDGDQSALVGRSFDAVIDTWTDAPRHIRSATALLGPNIGQYVFVSSLNAVADLSQRGLDESAPTTPLAVADRESDAPEHFGGRKAYCEQLLEEALGQRVTVLRPGLIVGPRDGSDRFTYWPVRVARGGEVLAPGDGSDPTQFIDARDLAEFLVRLVERRTTGLFHVVGPRERLSMRGLLEACLRASGSNARFTWVDTRFLMERQVAPWTDLPAWLPSLEEGHAFWTLDISKALAAGLAFRPLEQTVRDTLDWWNTLPEERRAQLKRGLSAERERALLAQWREHAAALSRG